MMITMTKVGRSYSYNPETFDLQYYLPSTYISPGPHPPTHAAWMDGCDRWWGWKGEQDSNPQPTSKGCQQTMYGG